MLHISSTKRWIHKYAQTWNEDLSGQELRYFDHKRQRQREKQKIQGRPASDSPWSHWNDAEERINVWPQPEKTKVVPFTEGPLGEHRQKGDETDQLIAQAIQRLINKESALGVISEFIINAKTLDNPEQTLLEDAYSQLKMIQDSTNYYQNNKQKVPDEDQETDIYRLIEFFSGYLTDGYNNPALSTLQRTLRLQQTQRFQQLP